MRYLYSAVITTIALLAASCDSALGQAVLITSPTTVGPTDTVIAGTPLATADITVQGTTLTINGRHTIKSLVLKRGVAATLTHGAAFTFDYSGGAGTDVVNGMALTITGDLTVESASPGAAGSINVSGRGFGPDAGPGKGTPSTNGSIGGAGGGYGGNGATASSSNTSFAGGSAYGSMTEPIDLGSGGGNYVGNLGSAGGGCVRITVNGIATVDGTIIADGGNAAGSAGAGSGGSIRLIATTLAGAGAIHANGGGSAWGGGAGGRVAVDWVNSTYTGTFGAAGAGPSSAPPGGAGTVALKPAGATGVDLIIDNFSSTSASYTPLTGAGAARSLAIRHGAFAQALDTSLTLPVTAISGTGGLNLRAGQVTINGSLSLAATASRITGTSGAAARLTVAGNMTVDATSFIRFDGLGFPGQGGPGAGQDSTTGSIGAAGGAHGGNGGNAAPFVGGTAYGSVTQPVTLGSGGGSFVGNPAGAGGGAIRVDVTGSLTLDGAVSANGSAGPSSSGGGAGGSVWINVGSLAGAGSIVANGGAGGGSWGSGGGGRVSINASAAPFTGIVRASPGGSVSPRFGGAGTIYSKLAADSLGTLVVDAQSVIDVAQTPIVAGPAYKSMSVRNKANVSVRMPITTTDLAVQSAGRLELQGDPFTVTNSLSVIDTGSVITGISQVASDLRVTGDASVGAGAAISLTGLGFPTDAGPGKGTASNNGGIGAAGAGHAGFGARSNNFAGGGAYGNMVTPTTFGSGGGNFVGNAGGAGGGVLKMTIGGTLTCDGTIAANGVQPPNSAGGGSGGSLWITTGTLAGAGTISVNGGNGGGTWGAAGAGRIAVYYTANTFTGTLQAIGGSGGSGGPARAGSGTIYLKQASAANPDIIVDGPGSGALSLLTPLTDVINARSLTVKNLANASWAGPAVINDATVQSAGRLEVGSGVFEVINSLLVTGANSLLTGQSLVGSHILAQNMTIATGASVSWAGLGYGTNDGPGAGTPSTSGGIGGAGGGYGGVGGSSGPFPGGATYGDAPNPFDFGSGGGSFVGNVAGSGGGLLFVDVPGVLTVNGALNCNGSQPPNSSGAGSGGSLYVKAGGLTGSGSIAANGGTGGGGNWGPGGGGRVAIYACGNSFPPANVTATKGAGAVGATNGSIVYGASSIAFDLSPSSQVFSYSQIVVLNAHATSTQPGGITGYQWRRRNAVGVYEPIPNNDLGRFFDTNSPQLTINGATCVDANSYDCLATDSCGSFPSSSAVLNIGRRFGDFDGSGGTPDANDIVAFFGAWLTGDVSADVDESGGTPDTTDITVFFQAWLDGC